MSLVNNIISYEEDQIRVNNEISLNDISNNPATLLIDKKNLESSSVRIAHAVLPNDLDYDP
ncbi:36227_t:CDS:1, partial [Racocetra persica]